MTYMYFDFTTAMVYVVRPIFDAKQRSVIADLQSACCISVKQFLTFYSYPVVKNYIVMN